MVLNERDKEKLAELLENSLDWGYLILNSYVNKTMNLFYSHLMNEKLVYLVQNRIVKLMRSCYCYCEQKYGIYKDALKQLSAAFNESNISYAIIKGFSLLETVYKKEYGVREFKDIDILICRQDIGKAKKIMTALGYRQGEFDKYSKKIVDISREEEIAQNLLSHELVPFFKPINDKRCSHNVIEVELNFTIFDGGRAKPPVATEVLLSDRAKVFFDDGSCFYTLNYNFNLIQLCVHLYKDTNYSFHKDLLMDITLMKFCDIREYILLLKDTDLSGVVKLANENGIADAVYFSLYFTDFIYEDIDLAVYTDVLRISPDFKNQVLQYENYFKANIMRKDFNKKDKMKKE